MKGSQTCSVVVRTEESWSENTLSKIILIISYSSDRVQNKTKTDNSATTRCDNYFSIRFEFNCLHFVYISILIMVHAADTLSVQRSRTVGDVVLSPVTLWGTLLGSVHVQLRDKLTLRRGLEPVPEPRCRLCVNGLHRGHTVGQLVRVNKCFYRQFKVCCRRTQCPLTVNSVWLLLKTTFNNWTLNWPWDLDFEVIWYWRFFFFFYFTLHIAAGILHQLPALKRKPWLISITEMELSKIMNPVTVWFKPFSKSKCKSYEVKNDPVCHHRSSGGF